MSANTAAIQQLYVAYFARPADPAGLAYWDDQITTGKITLAGVAQSFSVQTEYTALFANQTNVTIVNAIYHNLFGRDADTAGLLYWANQLTTGAVKVGVFTQAVINGAAAGSTDAAAIAAKVAAATTFTDALNLSPEIVAYDTAAGKDTAKGWLATVVDATTQQAAQATEDTVIAAIVTANANANGKTFTLTTGLDTVAGTAGNDVINATIDGTTGAVTTTLTPLDTINGAGGTDTLNLNILNGVGVAGTAVAALPSVAISGVEILNVRSAVALTADVSSWTDLTAANVTQGTSVALTAGSAAATSVSGVTGAVSIDGGASQTVTTSGTTVTLGATTATTGAIAVTHTAQAANAIAIDGGSTVAVTASGVTTGTIDIGAATAATGAVTVTSTGAAYVAATPVVLGAISVTGGTSVTVNQTATSSTAGVATDVAAAAITQSAVSVDGAGTATTVTVNQSAAVAAQNYVAAVAGKFETNDLTFAAMAAGDTTTVDGLTFTAARALTAAQAAAAFAGLKAGAVQGTAPVADGIYSGALSANWTSGAASSGKVTFAASAAATASIALAVAAGTVDPTVSNNVAGLTAVTGKAGIVGVVGGAVTITDSAATDVVAKVTLSGYGAGSTIASDALTSLSLSNSDKDVVVTNTKQATLALSVANLGTAANAVLNTGATYTTLNVTTAGTGASAVNLTAAGVKALTVAGTQSIDISGGALAAVETIVVSGAAGLVAPTAASATLKSINTTATTGAVTATIDGGLATYTGGAGVDTVTTATTLIVSKAISLGAGNDTLTLATGTTGATAVLDGGDGVDTLGLAAADAAALTATNTFAASIQNFERLSVGAVVAAASKVVDLANLDNISYVITNGIGAAGAIEFKNLANAGTLEMKGAAAGGTEITKLTMLDATGTADSVNLIAKVGTADLNFGEVQAAGVESVSLTVTDTSTSAAINTVTLKLTDAALSSLTLTGNANAIVTLDATDIAITKVDGSAMTGKLTFATASTNTAAAVVTGGSAADTLTANKSGDTLNGGAGNDTLKVSSHADLVTLTGGAGNDTFDFSTTAAPSNSNAYATITDLSVGDIIKFAVGATNFKAAGITLANTAVFQDFANQAVKTSTTADVAWFQFGGNTYVVENLSGGTSFVNGTDIIVKLTGAIDLSHSSFSSTAHTSLVIA